ncbi:hypothetical protein GCM10009677_62310 [Sphaerisporangium rubeum]|uniref:Uncharacterized protein n=1 Tax=Sphaerisporangium rubeum TaxID=321317 RepID=A0A7X0IHK1_9ACTN|nr:hypothetical protein [Sphaerisporangium rubeum]MBB6475321.1 hypothetical protein [Sphaerisporangium rubeum]
MAQTKKNKGFIAKYWGYALLLGLMAAWWLVDDKVKVAPFIIAGSLLAIYYFLFRVPRPCGAQGRDGACRNNAYGLMAGCQLQQHKRQNFFRRLGSEKLRRLNHGLWTSPKEGLASIAALASAVSCLAAIVALFLPK